VETIGQALRAGTNCGSCLPELKRIVADASAVTAPAAPSSQATRATGRRAHEPSSEAV
jgi:NAD(P)H-nitrite reductase large subunit